jgi:hypothetical protein
VPITPEWFGIFSELEESVSSRPPDYALIHAKSRDKLIGAIPKKRGNARDISLRTLNALR